MAENNTHYDVAIIGGGPAGLSAALVLTRALRRVLVIDAGRPRNRTTRELHNYLTRDGIAPREILELGRQEIAQYGATVVDDEVIEAVAIARDCPTDFAIRTQGGSRFRARKLLFTTGMRDELPTWPGFAECYGISTHHCPYCDALGHRGRVIAATGRNVTKAVGLALTLLRWTPQVIVLTDGEPLAEKETLQKIARHGLKCCTEPIQRLMHDDGKLREIQFAGDQRVAADALFFNTDQVSRCELPAALGCTLRGEGDSPTNQKQQTVVPGVFLAGDADGDVQFVIVAAAEGATAAVTINRELQDEDLARVAL